MVERPRLAPTRSPIVVRATLKFGMSRGWCESKSRCPTEICNRCDSQPSGDGPLVKNPGHGKRPVGSVWS